MYKVNHPLNYDHTAHAGEINDQPSETIPDESMSIREILARFAQGLSVGGGRTPIYDEDDDFPDPRTLDLAEIQDLRERYEAELADRKAKAEAARLERQQRKIKAENARFEAFKKRMDAETKKAPDPGGTNIS